MFRNMIQGAGGGGHYGENPSPELELKATRTGDKMSETLHVVANEPSLAFFRIQEHVRKSLPQLVDKKHDVEELQQHIQGACFDMDYATKAVTGMENSAANFGQIQTLLKNSMFIKQQLEYEQGRSATHHADIPVSEDSPRARSSSLSNHTWVGPASLLR